MHEELFLKPSTTPYNPAHHYFAVGTAAATFLLLLAGALVTSNDAGLSVPDWPTSFGSLYRLPPMKGGILFEHGHRMVAETVGLLMIVLAIWTWRVDKRRWMRRLGFWALAGVIVQGILGGITVLFFLPPAVSTAHATLAQTFFVTIVAMALFTSRGWLETPRLELRDPGRPRIMTRALVGLALASVYLQLILGAAFRHSALKLLPHLIMAAVVTVTVLWVVTRLLRNYGSLPQLRRPAQILLGLIVLQLSLGFGAYLTRVEWGKDAPQPLLAMVVTTVAHVAVGALVLATTAWLALQVQRHLAPSSKQAPAAERSESPQAVIA
ncbi:MAG TPA: COX15/CtaA family protein [Terriglobales bacterium]|nr:COX15/CtaA family protein [Terriglobales bacterium]